MTYFPLDKPEIKKESWECADLLLINKMTTNQVRNNRRNTFMMWFEYQKDYMIMTI